ncbi:MAG: serine/threonine-protein kinase [Thermoguttaceae bacterium]
MSDLDLLKLAVNEKATHPDPAFADIGEIQAAFEQLEILEPLGTGGMGVVYKARQKKLDRLVALKIMPKELAKQTNQANLYERFEREGRLLAKLTHPNIVAVYDFGETDSFLYLIMEYVEGVNLRQAMNNEKFSPEQALAIVPEICDALAYAHAEGVLHRDVKPENILLDIKGRVKIADFGISRLAYDESQPDNPLANNSHTQSGEMLGTPFYAAPEQLESAGTVDNRADIYSLGVVFYELLTGELPIGRFAPPSEKSTVSSRIDPVVLKSLEKEREKRQRTATELKTEIKAATEAGAEQLIQSTSVREEKQSGKKSGVKPLIAGLLALIFAVGVPYAVMEYTMTYWIRPIDQANTAINEREIAQHKAEMMQQAVTDATNKQFVENKAVRESVPANEEEAKERDKILALANQKEKEHYDEVQRSITERRYENEVRARRFFEQIHFIRMVGLSISASVGIGFFIIATIMGWKVVSRTRPESTPFTFWSGFVILLLFPIVAVWGVLLLIFVCGASTPLTWTVGNLVGIGFAIFFVTMAYRRFVVR